MTTMNRNSTDDWFADLAYAVSLRDRLHARAAVLAERVGWTREWLRQAIAYAGQGMARADVMRAELALQEARAEHRAALVRLAQAEDAIAWFFATETTEIVTTVADPVAVAVTVQVEVTVVAAAAVVRRQGRARHHVVRSRAHCASQAPRVARRGSRAIGWNGRAYVATRAAGAPATNLRHQASARDGPRHGWCNG